MSITEQVIILFLVVLVGVVCRKLGYFTDECIHGITQLIVNVTLPFLTISNMQRPFSMEVLQNFLLTIVISMLVIGISMCAGMLIFRKRPKKKRAVLVNLSAFSNCGFMGYPIILAINPDYMIYAVAYNVAYNILSWTIGVSQFQAKGSISLRRVLINPNIISAVIGFVLFCTGITLPEIPAQVLSLVGGLTTPLSMLLIGTRLCGLRLSEFKDIDYHLISLLRLVVMPLATFLLMRPFPIAAAVSSTVFVLTAMPAATMTAMQAELYDGDTAFAARAIAYSTLLSLVSVPLMSLLL